MKKKRLLTKLGRVALVVALISFTNASSADTGYTDDCITFSSDGGFTLNVQDNMKSWNGTLYWSTNKTTWTEWDAKEITAGIKGDSYKLYVRGNKNNTVITTYNNTKYCWQLTPVGENKISCTGNIETLRGATGNNPSPIAMGSYCYAYMFKGCTSLTNAPALPAETLASDCYSNMFKGCTSLTNAPALPAETLASDCYYSMFSGCTSLTNAPALPAETLASNCYDNMFNGCTSLTTAPALPAETLALYCYNRMFSGCKSLTTVPNLPATNFMFQCYYNMFNGCTSLVVNTIAPGRKWSIPAGVVTAKNWNTYMFRGTGGDFTGGPEIGQTYFVESDWKQEIELGGGMKARDYGDGDWVIVGEGELSAEQTAKVKDEPITNLWIHTGITSVGENAFTDKAFWKLREVTLGTNCTSVGLRAFKQCYGLTNVVTRATDAIEFGAYAFSGCHSLEGLSFASTPTFGEGAYSFQTAIYMREGGIPEVYTMPKLTISGMSEHIMGKKELDDDEWTDVTNLSDEEKKAYHFFKVEMQ